MMRRQSFQSDVMSMFGPTRTMRPGNCLETGTECNLMLGQSLTIFLFGFSHPGRYLTTPSQRNEPGQA
jgi:hypothetical protein